MISEIELKKYWDTYYERLILFAKRFGVPDSYAQDLVVDVFVRVWKYGQEDKNVTTLLFTSTKNACLDYFRSGTNHYKEYQEWMDEIEDVIVYGTLLEGFVIAAAYEMAKKSTNEGRIFNLI